MKKIQFDKKNIINYINEGSESKVYSYKNDENIVVIKIFKDEFVTPTKTEKIPEKVLKNKERKLILLSQSEFLYDDEKPIDLVYDGDRFIAYTMFYNNSIKLDNYYDSSIKEKEKVLNTFKERIEMLNKNGIYLGDMNLENIGVRKNGSIRLGDIDNISIGGLPFDRESYLVQLYKKRCSKIDNVDNYSFNILSLALLNKKDFMYVQRHIDKSLLSGKYNNDENKNLINELIDINDNYQPKYIIDNKESKINKIKKRFRH